MCSGQAQPRRRSTDGLGSALLHHPVSYERKLRSASASDLPLPRVVVVPHRLSSPLVPVMETWSWTWACSAAKRMASKYLEAEIIAVMVLTVCTRGFALELI